MTNLFPDEQEKLADLVMIVEAHSMTTIKEGMNFCPLGTYKDFCRWRKTIFEELLNHFNELSEELKKEGANYILEVKSLEYMEINGEQVLHFGYDFHVGE